MIACKTTDNIKLRIKKIWTTVRFKKVCYKDQGVNAMYYDKIVAAMPTNMTPHHWRTSIEYFSIRCFSRLMMDRIIFLGTEWSNCKYCSSTITILRKRWCFKDIQIYLNSPGGSVCRIRDLWHDAIHQARRCYNLYRNGSFYRAVLLCAGAPGKRSAYIQE
jgi:ATP-dependent Clp protease protease subunit